MTSDELLAKNGLTIPEILLPNNVDLAKWPVVACDQFTSQPEYWEETIKIVGDNPSTLKITLPEIFLEHTDFENKIKNVNDEMQKYINDGILQSIGKGLVLTQRIVHNKSRLGLVIAVDLEAYDFSPNSNSIIRATEGTVIDRLPPRMKIRKNAVIETPHILLLMEDKDKTIIEDLFKLVEQGKLFQLYSQDLMQDGGHVNGWLVNGEHEIDDFAEKINALREKVDLLFAVGDGNHSLASAKQHWENLKVEGADESNPARYALVELMNVYDDGLVFEPIHRVLFNCDHKIMLSELDKFVCEHGGSMEIKYFVGSSAQKKLFDNWNKIEKFTCSQPFAFVTESVCGIAVMDNTDYSMTVGTVQAFLDEFLAKNSDCRIDYIHGQDVTCELGSQAGNVGVILPNMDKSCLFSTVVSEGVLPRKTFSMGEANEKRYYMECRKIK